VAWNGIHTFISGELVTDVTMNNYISTNLQYLKDLWDGVQNQSLTMGNNIPINFKDNAGAAQLGIRADASNNIWIQMLNAGALLKVVNFAGALDLFHVDNNGQLQAYGNRLVFKDAATADSRAHRHYEANDLHIERGSQSLASVTTGAAITFARPFTVAPAIALGMDGSDSPALCTALSATQITLRNGSGTGPHNVSFVAVGIST
jgi:hypothetical protein